MSKELKNIPVCCNSNNESDSKTSYWKIYFIIGIICVVPFVTCAATFKTEVLENEHYIILLTYFASCLDNSTGTWNILIQLVYYSIKFIFCMFMILAKMLDIMFETFSILFVTSCLVYVNWFQRRLKECDDIEEVKCGHRNS